MNRLTRMLVGATLALVTSPAVLAQQPATEADPTIRDVHAGETVKVARIPDKIYLRDVNDPADIIWDRIPAYRTLVSAAPPVHRSTWLRFDPKGAEHLYFQVARTSQRFYVRLRWHDESANRESKVDVFADGAAVQFALNGVDTNYMMGTGPDKPVNIWYWRADHEQVENLAAGGFGSTSRLAEQPVTGKAIYRKLENRQPEWHLVMSRPIDSVGEHQAGLKDGTVPVAFALWQGAEGQRDGTKRVSHSWIMVEVEPPPLAQQPPEQTPERRAREAAAAERAKKGETQIPPDKAKQVPKGGQFY